MQSTGTDNAKLHFKTVKTVFRSSQNVFRLLQASTEGLYV